MRNKLGKLKRLQKQKRIKPEKNTEYCMHRDVQRDGEIEERDQEMKTQRQIHTDMGREQGEDLEASLREKMSLDETTPAQVVPWPIPRAPFT